MPLVHPEALIPLQASAVAEAMSPWLGAIEALAYQDERAYAWQAHSFAQAASRVGALHEEVDAQDPRAVLSEAHRHITKDAKAVLARWDTERPAGDPRPWLVAARLVAEAVARHARGYDQRTRRAADHAGSLKAAHDALNACARRVEEMPPHAGRPWQRITAVLTELLDDVELAMGLAARLRGAPN